MPGIRCIYKAALALVVFLRKPTSSTKSLECQRKNATIYCHARARLQGLQADPQTLAEPNAQIKRPCKTSASTAVRRLALMGRAVSEDCQAASATLLHPVNPLPFITRSARLNPLPRAARCKSPLGCLLIAHEVWRLSPFSPANFANSAILPTDKISASLIEILLTIYCNPN